MSRKKRHFILIAIVLAGVLSVGCIFTIHSLRGRREAINAAEEYLREKYLTQMTILSAKYKYRNAHGLINEYYYVSASPVDAPEIVFQVVIDAVSGAPVRKSGGYQIPDNYIQICFRLDLERELGAVIKKIWGDQGSLKVYLFDRFQNTEGLDENLPLSTLSQSIEYELRIDTNCDLNRENTEQEASKIFRLIDELKQLELAERRIVLSYDYKNNSMNYRFDAWSLLTKEEIELQLEEYQRKGAG